MLGLSFGLAVFEPRSIPVLTIDPEERRQLLGRLYVIGLLDAAVWVAGMLALVIAVSGLLYRYVEQPARDC